MRSTVRRLLACCTLVLAAVASTTGRAEEPPKFWAVTGVRADDVLHLRDVPSADSKSLAQIPPNARGLKHLGCRRNQPPMDLWARMSEAQRREALTLWCRVEYRGHEGWVAGRFLKPDNKAAR
jgi:hypothetical protein